MYRHYLSNNKVVFLSEEILKTPSQVIVSKLKAKEVFIHPLFFFFLSARPLVQKQCQTLEYRWIVCEFEYGRAYYLWKALAVVENKPKEKTELGNQEASMGDEVTFDLALGSVGECWCGGSVVSLNATEKNVEGAGPGRGKSKPRSASLVSKTPLLTP